MHAVTLLLAADFAVVYRPELVDEPQELKQLVSDCRALIVRNRTQVREDLLQLAQRLRVVGRLGVGLDNIDVAACQRADILVMPATGANTLSVAEYVMSGILMLVRGAYFDSAAVLAGEWPRQRLQGGEIYGRRLGLLGCGGIAREVAVRAQSFGMQIMAFDPLLDAADPVWAGISRFENLAQMLAQCDVLSLHVPLNDATRHIIDSNALGQMPPGAILINSARGGIVDEAALADALRSGHLGGAMLDVFEDEPLAANSQLTGVQNLLLTPHIAGVTRESNQRVSQVTAENVRRILESGK